MFVPVSAQPPKRRGRPRQSTSSAPAEGSASLGGAPDPLLDAALALFVERGVDGTPVPLIAERAGVGVGTLYRRFESKELLVNRLFRHWKRAYSRHLYYGFPLGVPLREQFRFFWSRLTSFAQANEDAFLFLEMHHHSSHLDEESRALEQEVSEPFRRFLQSQAGALKSLDPEAMRAFILGAFVNVVQASRSGALELTPELLDGLEECAWHAVAAAPQGQPQVVSDGGGS